MKKILSTLAILTASFSLATAGDWGGKSPIAPSGKGSVGGGPSGCACYDSGFEFGGYLSAWFPDGDSSYEDEIGGGASLSYFATPNFGIEAAYSVIATDSEKQIATVNAVYRFVNTASCVAPYVMAGGGLQANGSNHGLLDVGAGIDMRFESWGCIGLFADATYNWVEDAADFTLVRAGIKIPF